MDRVLKRVGLSKRNSETKTPQAPLDSDEKSGNVRRRRRSKSRRRANQDTKKSRGLFNIDWESVKDCKSCKSRAITRRLCSKRCDNELYRSNSFKFERFVRGSEEISTLGKKISLCDDYSLPVDHLNKRRPNSFAGPSLSEWNIFTPNDETVEVLETYSTPRDSRQQLSQNEDAEPKCYTSPDREYSQPYTTEGSSSPSSDEEFFGHLSIAKPLELNSPDSIAEAILPLLNLQSPERSDIKRHPSPYYYADLYKDNSDDSPLKTVPNKYRKQLDCSAKRISINSETFQSNKHTIETQNQKQDNQTSRQLKYQNNKSLSLDTPSAQADGRLLSTGQLKYRKSCSLDHESSCLNLNLKEESEFTGSSFVAGEAPETPGDDVECADSTTAPSKPATRVTPTTTTCGCFTPEDGVDEDMTRQRHVYETAFDCRVSKSDDDLDQLDKVTNHPVLIQLNSVKGFRTANSTAPIAVPEEDDADPMPKNLRKALTFSLDSSSSILQQVEAAEKCSALSALSENFQDLCSLEPSGTSSTTGLGMMENSSKSATTSVPMCLRMYTPSPPSTAPLPTKFYGKDSLLNSIRSTPNLPSHPKARLKDLRLPIKSLRGRQNHTSLTSDTCLFDLDSAMSIAMASTKGAGRIITDKNEMLKKLKDRLGLTKEGTDLKTEKGNIAEIKDRPLQKTSKKHSKSSPKDMLREFKGPRRRHKYSSTESITTSSSGGSMESIRSSTSEGNRSTTSSESRHSTSLSSHSSDSGGGYRQRHHMAQTSGFLQHANKLHILSPISDKSSQEPGSETSDNNRNNNSQKCSPEVAEKDAETNTATTETTLKQLKQRRMPQNKNLLNIGFQQQQQVGGRDSEIQGSDSGISIQSREGIKPRFGTTGFLGLQSHGLHGQQDFSDLPFDMPKLRRRRLPTSQDVCTSGSATSIDLRDLPFDMPKLRRRLRVPQQQLLIQQQQHESSVSQASSSQSVVDAERQIDFQPKLTLNLLECNSRPRAGLSMNVGGLGLQLNFTTNSNLTGDAIDIGVPLEKQGWYHGAITRVEAECVLQLLREGSFLVRNSESARQDYSLSLKSARGFMHMRIQQNRSDGSFILGQFSKPFQTIPEMIRHFSLNRLPIRGAEHMCLIQPVIAQLL